MGFNMVWKILVLHACAMLFVLLLVILTSSLPGFAAFADKFTDLIGLVLVLFGVGYLVIIFKARKKGDFPTNILEQFLYVNLGIKIKRESKSNNTEEEEKGVKP